jgi:DNA methyltransferase 1-associated protein 1
MKQVKLNSYRVSSLIKVRLHILYHHPSHHSLAERELTRKKYLVSLENRTPEQLVEEEALYIEIKRLEQNERQFKRERDELLRTLAGIDSGLPDVVEDEGLMNLVVDVKKKKKGVSGMDVDSPSTPVLSAMPAMKRLQSAKTALHGIHITQFPSLTS